MNIIKVIIFLLVISFSFPAIAGKQEKREAFIQKLIGAGYFKKVYKPADYAHVVVTPGFYKLDFGEKQSYINVVYTYYIESDPKANILVLDDSRTGKRVGTFTSAGLKMK